MVLDVQKELSHWPTHPPPLVSVSFAALKAAPRPWALKTSSSSSSVSVIAAVCVTVAGYPSISSRLFRVYGFYSTYVPPGVLWSVSPSGGITLLVFPNIPRRTILGGG